MKMLYIRPYEIELKHYSEKTFVFNKHFKWKNDNELSIQLKKSE